MRPAYSRNALWQVTKVRAWTVPHTWDRTSGWVTDS